MCAPSPRPTVIVLAVLAGCGGLPRGTPALRPNQDQAVQLVWKTVYGRTDDAPRVLWIERAELVCTDPNSQKPGFNTVEGCREGLTIEPFEVRVAWNGQDVVSGTTMAHEFLHALLGREGVIDPNHKTEGFRPLDECGENHCARCGLVDTANRKLAAEGL